MAKDIQNQNNYSLDDIFSNINIEDDKPSDKTIKTPFKFLDSYTIEDKEIFFGRDNEIEELYRKFYTGKTLLVYGKSGTGKSSIINCGLISKIPSSDIFKINVRCGNKAYSNLLNALKIYSKRSMANIVEITENIYFQRYKPITIIFDQFEEFFILSNKNERRKFLKAIKELVTSRLNIKIVFIIREEYYANLTEFEKEMPGLYNNKMRIEQMGTLNVTQAIEKPCAICNIKIEKHLSETIIKQLTTKTSGIELTWFQVIMDRLYRMAIERKSENIELKHQDLEKLGRIENILSAFLEEQLKLMTNRETGEAILKAMVSGNGTKKLVGIQEIKKTLQSIGKPIDIDEIKQIIQHFINVRILTDKNKQELYELRHDSLAAKIFEKFSIHEKELLEARLFIENAFDNYKKRNILLSPTDLKYIEPYKEKVVYRNDIEEFITKKFL